MIWFCKFDHGEKVIVFSTLVTSSKILCPVFSEEVSGEKYFAVHLWANEKFSTWRFVFFGRWNHESVRAGLAFGHDTPREWGQLQLLSEHYQFCLSTGVKDWHSEALEVGVSRVGKGLLPGVSQVAPCPSLSPHFHRSSRWGVFIDCTEDQRFNQIHGASTCWLWCKTVL